MSVNAVWYVSPKKGSNVKVLVCKDYDILSRRAASLVASVVAGDPKATLGLATGSSPVGMYQNLIKLYEDGILDFSKIKTINLDEYYPLDPSNDQSYHYFMNDNLFDHINIDKNNVHVPDGNAADIDKAAEEYEKLINDNNGTDIQVLGIGQNGHIGFNEPSDTFVGPTHVVTLTESTIKANSRFFEKIEDVPTKAISMGIAGIMKAKKVLLVANGENKADAIMKTLEGPITPHVPASILQLHPDVTFIIDEAAASKLQEYRPE